MPDIEMTKWDERFFDLCHLVASWSEDRGRRVGSVIVGPLDEVRAVGCNGFPAGVDAKVEARHDRTGNEKYFWVEHSERNAIYSAARTGIPLNGCRIYSSLFPCADCTRAIIQSGIVQLNTFAAPENDSVFNRSYQVAKDMLMEAGVEVRLFPMSEDLYVPAKADQ